MLKLICTAVLLAACPLAGAAESAAGRWEGVIPVTDFPLHATIDIAPDGAGAWRGSITLPELNIAGAPLADISLRDNAVALTIKDVLVDAVAGPARFQGRLDSQNAMSGTFVQAGNTASFTLHRTGDAQVQTPRSSTAVGKSLEGKWVGDYELGGYARHVTLRLTDHPGAPATADFIIVGKKENVLPVDFVAVDEGLLRVESRQTGINFEGRVRKDTGDLSGTCEQGPIEVPLTLHRASETQP